MVAEGCRVTLIFEKLLYLVVRETEVRGILQILLVDLWHMLRIY